MNLGIWEVLNTEMVISSVWKGDGLIGKPLTCCSLPGFCKGPTVTSRFIYPEYGTCNGCQNIRKSSFHHMLKAQLIQWTSATKALQLKLQKMAGRSAKVGGRGNDSMSAKTPKNWRKHVNQSSWIWKQTRKTALWMWMHNGGTENIIMEWAAATVELSESVHSQEQKHTAKLQVGTTSFKNT